MKVQNWKRRRTLTTLLALPLVASTVTSVNALAANEKKADYTPKSSYQQSAPPKVTYQPAPAPRVDYTPKPSYQPAPAPKVTYQPAPQAPAPAPKADYSPKSSYPASPPPTVTYQPAPQAPAPAPKVDYSPKSSYPTSPPPKVTYQPAPQAPAPAPRPDYSPKTQYQQPPPKVTSQPAPQAPAPAPKVDYSPKTEYKQSPPKVVYQPAPVAPAQKATIPITGYNLPQATIRTNSSPITTFNGKPYQSAQSDGKGQIQVKNEVTGKSTTFDTNTGKGQTKNKAGTVTKDFSQSNNGYKMNTITFKGAGDTLKKKEYVTRPITIPTSTGSGTRVVEHYIPRDRTIVYRDTSSFDYMLMWMLINQANQQHQHNGGGGYYPSESAGYGGGMSIPAPAKVASGFEIDWSKKFDIVPDTFGAGGTMTYKNPADAVASYVSLDIINDNSEVPGFWGKVAHYASFGMYDHTKNLKKFEFDSSARTPLTQQVTAMAGTMLKNSEVDLKGVIDEKTGELVKDAGGNVPTYYFVVDPSNAMQVKDAETQQTCNLAVASIIRPTEALVTGDLRFMKVKVLGGGRTEGSCKAKQVVMVEQGDLEEMNNDLAAKVDEAIHAIPKMSKPTYN